MEQALNKTSYPEKFENIVELDKYEESNFLKNNPWIPPITKEFGNLAISKTPKEEYKKLWSKIKESLKNRKITDLFKNILNLGKDVAKDISYIHISIANDLALTLAGITDKLYIWKIITEFYKLWNIYIVTEKELDNERKILLLYKRWFTGDMWGIPVPYIIIKEKWVEFPKWLFKWELYKEPLNAKQMIIEVDDIEKEGLEKMQEILNEIWGPKSI